MMTMTFLKQQSVPDRDLTIADRSTRQFPFDFQPAVFRFRSEDLRTPDQIAEQTMDRRQLKTRIAAPGIDRTAAVFRRNRTGSDGTPSGPVSSMTS